MEEAVFGSYWNRHPRYKFAFLACNAFVEPPFVDCRMCYVHYSMSHIIDSNQGAHFSVNEV